MFIPTLCTAFHIIVYGLRILYIIVHVPMCVWWVIFVESGYFDDPLGHIGLSMGRLVARESLSPVEITLAGMSYTNALSTGGSLLHPV